MKFHVYKDKKGEFRWKLINRKKTIADSGEGYKNKKDVLRVLGSIQGKVNEAVVVDETVVAAK